MKIDEKTAETDALLEIAKQMCAAVRTAPKAKGIDRISTLILTGDDKNALAAEMDRLAEPLGYAFFNRDAENVRAAGAVVLAGTSEGTSALGDSCGMCHLQNCMRCTEHGGLCAFDPINLGIAIGSAVTVASSAHVDNRIMFSAGRAALEMGLFEKKIKIIMAIPLSVTGKSPFFDRK
ncbi:MAG: DUF2148 domain-containing protein [Oscillospiraceae bacterium]